MGRSSSKTTAFGSYRIMKLVGILQGIVAYRAVQEEYLPERSPPIQDLIRLVCDTYQFLQFPTFSPEIAAPLIFNFNNGKFSDKLGTFAITQLVMTSKGDAVAAASTDQADSVLEHLIELLDTHFGYRIRQSNKTKIYWSQVVVEFDSSIEAHIEKLGTIEQTITQHVKRNERFKLKGFTFGTSTAILPTQSDAIDILERQDFVIERRVDRPFEENRFFSSAPMRTADHVQLLTAIEAVMRDR
jgi:hypothetical protein